MFNESQSIAQHKAYTDVVLCATQCACTVCRQLAILDVQLNTHTEPPSSMDVLYPEFSTF